MWPFHKKTTIAHSRLLAGGSDHHSHILPGVDDGIESIEEALNVLALYQRTGIKELWLTPHIMEDFPNTPALLQERFAALRAAYKGEITLHLAAEYMIDAHFPVFFGGIAVCNIQSEITEGGEAKGLYKLNLPDIAN